MGIEPTTFGLGGRCSTFELHGLGCSTASLGQLMRSFCYHSAIKCYNSMLKYNLYDLGIKSKAMSVILIIQCRKRRLIVSAVTISLYIDSSKLDR